MFSKVIFLQLGRFKSDLYEKLFESYLDRMKHYVKVETKEFKILRDEPDYFKKIEEKLLSSLKDSVLISFSESGELYDSIKFSDFIEKGVGTLSVIVGSSWGLPSYLKERSKHVLSMGRMTLPHESVRVLAAEQLYRACTIIRKENYHK